MADTFSKLFQDDLTVLGTPVLVASAVGEQTIVKHMRVVNQNSGGTTAFRMWHTTLAGPTTSDQLIVPIVDIASGGWTEFEGTIILNSGEALYASKETSSVSSGSQTADLTITTYGLEMAP